MYKMGQNFHKIEAVRLEGGGPPPPPSGQPDRFFPVFFLITSLSKLVKVCIINLWLSLCYSFEAFTAQLQLLQSSQRLSLSLPAQSQFLHDITFCKFSQRVKRIFEQIILVLDFLNEVELLSDFLNEVELLSDFLNVGAREKPFLPSHLPCPPPTLIWGRKKK